MKKLEQLRNGRCLRTLSESKALSVFAISLNDLYVVSRVKLIY